MTDTIEKFRAIARNVGHDMYAQLSDSDKGLIAFGMTDVAVIEAFQSQMTPTMQEYGVPASELSGLETQFTLGLMDAATEQGKMIA